MLAITLYFLSLGSWTIYYLLFLRKKLLKKLSDNKLGIQAQQIE